MGNRKGRTSSWSSASDTTGTKKRVVKVRPGDITPDHESQLRDKVRSKIEVAKVLGGTIMLTLGFVITNESVNKADIKEQVAVIALL